MPAFSSEVWLAAIGATTVISLVPLTLLLLFPFHKLKPDSKVLKIFLAFAFGGLLGDVFLHLLPHAAHPHDSPLPVLEAALDFGLHHQSEDAHHKSLADSADHHD